MKQNRWLWTGLSLFLVLTVCAAPSFAGVSRAIQDRYRKEWENKALFLKIPIYGEKAFIHITGRNYRAEEGTGTARYKVGDQLRVLGLDFSNEEIRFKMGQVASAVGVAEIVFRFDANLQENFPNSDVFEKALQGTFTEGLKFTDIEEAKRGYVEDQFDRTVREMAETSGTNRESVLKAIAPRLPAYQDAVKDIENLKSRNQDISNQLAQTQADNRKLEAELRNQVSESNRLRKENASMNEKIESSSAQLGKLGEEIRNVRGLTQSYQKEIANVQRSLNIKVDSNRDLASQIGDLGQLLQKLQKDNGALDSLSTSLRQNLENQQSANAKLLGENDDLKSANAKMRDTIGTLTSKEDSLARQYLDVKQNRDNLENLALAVQNLNTRVTEESTDGGVYTGKFNVYLRDVPLGSITLRIPDSLAPDQETTGEAEFLSESVDYVKLSADERHILRSLGDKLKMQLKLASGNDSVVVAPEKGDSAQEIGERDRATWRWKITNRGTQDARVFLAARLINKNSDEIPLLEEEHLIKSSNIVRQFRNYLQPVPMTLGAVIGFLLFGIVSIFRRKGPGIGRKHRGVAGHDSSTYVGQKQL
jgi:uncharacterized coiled-coil DUF342 family protein